jgi:hypothetical protein
MMAANASVLPLYEPRNVIMVLPAVGMLVAAGLRAIRWPLVAGTLLAVLIVANIAAGANLRPAKPPWAMTFQELIRLRKEGEPTLLKVVEPSSVEAYYARTLPLRNATTIDLPAAPLAPERVREMVNSLPVMEPVWLILPYNVADSWVALAELERTRQVGWRRSVEYMLFYRFDPGGGSSLQFTFGDRLRYAGRQIGGIRTVRAGTSLCLDLPLTVITSLDGEYSYGLHLVEAGGRLVAQRDTGLGAPAPGSLLALSPCLALPSTLPPGRYAAHFLVYRWQDGARLPVLENGVAWGDTLVVAVVEVEG